MTAPEPVDSRALTALTGLLRSSTKRPSKAELARGLDVLRGRIASDGLKPRRAYRWSLVAAALTVCVVLASVAVFALLNPSVPAAHAVAVSRIEGGKILDGGYLSESGRAGIKLFFNEGSRFVMSSGTRGRLRVVPPDGARFALEQGSASFEITHDPGRRWAVEAGPFVVTVKGTDFTVTWDAVSERFELRLRRGRVSVSGPMVGGDLALGAGQKLTVSLPRAETVITELRTDEPTTESTPPSSSSAALAPTAASKDSSEQGGAVPTASATHPAASASAAGNERRWREALAHGQWDRILSDVERDGVEATLQNATSDDLFALADAARYRRRVDLARAALVSHRRRFPSSPRSLDAVFLLGRVEELRDGGRKPAIAFYDEYLSRAPTGTYAAEALGRKMILSSEVGGPASARPMAEEYLKRFPKGSHAGAARALTRMP
jgi:ferric-dicitrate binding protein FerR (iron transport regulator)